MIIRWNSPWLFLKAVFGAFKYLKQGRPVITPPDIQQERISECLKCFHRVNNQCKLCTCLIDVKTMLSSESCPDFPQRWKKLTFSGKSPKALDVA